MAAAEFEVEAARRQLERVLASAGFSRNERLARLLQFVVEQHLEGKDDEIKESVIALEVFGRGPDHDPKQDSIVRTEAGRLRARLGEYYLGEGKNDALVIELPKGGYAPAFRQAAVEPAITSSGPAAHSPRPGLRGRLEKYYSGRMETGKPVARKSWHTAAAWIGLLAIASLGGLAVFRSERKSSMPRPDKSIAVLPFLDLSPTKDQEYFCDRVSRGAGAGHLRLNRSLTKYGCIAALRQFDYQRIAFPCAYIVFTKPCSQPGGFSPHDRILLGVMIRPAPEDLECYHGFLDLVVLALQMQIGRASCRERV